MRMQFVDGDIEMPVIGVLMHSRDTLMLGEADRIADRIFVLAVGVSANRIVSET